MTALLKKTTMRWLARYYEAKRVSQHRPSFRGVALMCLRNYLNDRRMINLMDKEIA